MAIYINFICETIFSWKTYYPNTNKHKYNNNNNMLL